MKAAYADKTMDVYIGRDSPNDLMVVVSDARTMQTLQVTRSQTFGHVLRQYERVIQVEQL